MKQGSTDDPFADDPPAPTGADDGGGDGGDEAEPGADSLESASITGGGGPVQQRSLPYIHARDGVKDGRTQRPIFLRDHVEDGLDDLIDELEAELGEDVYKTDVTEAAMAVAVANPDLVLAKLEEWGYGWT